MSKLKDYFGLIIAFAATIGIVLGAVNYFAKASDVELVQLRLEQKIVSDQQFSVQQQIWNLEDRNRQYGTDCSKWPDERDRRQYKELKAQYDQLDQKQKVLMKR